MPERKKEIISLEKAIYLIINKELSDIELANWDEEDEEKCEQCPKSNNKCLDTVQATHERTIYWGEP